MLRLRLTIDCHPRTNSGAPAHSTTGVASTNSIHVRIDPGIIRASGRPGIMSDISIRISGSASATLIQKRRVISASSGDGSSPATAARGSNTIPQIGQLPGSARTICGCIGQTYSVFETGWIGARDSSAIPHFGHDPGRSCRISGCIGQVYEVEPAAAGVGALLCAGSLFGAPRAKTPSGSFLNLSRQRRPQKWYVVPLCSNDPLLVAGSTCIPQTGSVTLLLIGADTLAATEVPASRQLLQASTTIDWDRQRTDLDLTAWRGPRARDDYVRRLTRSCARLSPYAPNAG